MVIIQDDFFTQDISDQLSVVYRNGYIKNHPFILKKDYDQEIHEIVSFASTHFDFSSVLGCEIWTNSNQVTPVRHTDHDMRYFVETGIERYPKCTMVYYPFVSPKIFGGNLHVEDKIVVPRTNRLVVFSPGLLHHIEPFEGERISVVYNPWDYNPNP